MNMVQEKKRPPALTYLCLGSFFIGVSWIVMLVVLLLQALRGNVPATHFPGLVIEYLNAGYLFLAVFFSLTVLGLVSVVLMWKMKKAGFYLYVAAKTTLYFIPVAIIGNNHLTFMGLFLTSLGIIAYGVVYTSRKANL